MNTANIDQEITTISRAEIQRRISCILGRDVTMMTLRDIEMVHNNFVAASSKPDRHKF